MVPLCSVELLKQTYLEQGPCIQLSTSAEPGVAMPMVKMPQPTHPAMVSVALAPMRAALQPQADRELPP